MTHTSFHKKPAHVAWSYRLRRWFQRLAFRLRQKFEEPPAWSGEPPEANEILLENLRRFGLEDIEVTGAGKIRYLYSDERTTITTGAMPLSQMCGDVWPNINIRGDRCILDTNVLQNGVKIGHVNSDHTFHYTAAPDLRTALGWLVATDLGHGKIIRGFDLDRAARELEEVLRQAPAGNNEGANRRFCLDVFQYRVHRMFEDNHLSRFGNGGHEDFLTLWGVGTRALYGHRLDLGEFSIQFC